MDHGKVDYGSMDHMICMYDLATTIAFYNISTPRLQLLFPLERNPRIIQVGISFSLTL